jgi:hypothetical protein
MQYTTLDYYQDTLFFVHLDNLNRCDSRRNQGNMAYSNSRNDDSILDEKVGKK